MAQSAAKPPIVRARWPYPVRGAVPVPRRHRGNGPSPIRVTLPPGGLVALGDPGHRRRARLA